jgi:hypothetical protein
LQNNFEAVSVFDGKDLMPQPDVDPGISTDSVPHNSRQHRRIDRDLRGIECR